MGKVLEHLIGEEIKEGKCCPECNITWDGGDIYEHFLEAKFNPLHEQHSDYKVKSLEEIKKYAKSYGWSVKTKRRFGSKNLIGIDASMDPNAKDFEQYDGVTYWFCKGCGVAWNKFNGTRTEKFKGELGHVKEDVPVSSEDDDNQQIIYNAMQTPDGTIISSDHRHDYVMHEDKNGKTYGVDGGQAYLRRTGDIGDCKDLSMYLEPWTPEFHKKAREVVKRGGRGKDGRQPLAWVPICEMNDNWVVATIEYNEERNMSAKTSWFTELLVNEVEYREMNSITIDE